ncbi:MULTISPECIES: prolyl oligopeptidase family serine peptidase [unclassified Rhodococcus (in: high G+C Gram-positive bacteria)]|uniref:dipeptidyl-peptidase 5 n=1 Tax=unclassified Rhodococcus (in: high G+C Gram-positive bacteria) TaxID=192944 RepID=UPI000B9BFC81|nr:MULTISPECIES: prolyl oligopeptidase family serine peptidase [unclassified Rhodococcus (in: high G+C Gram-positive bacteria)]OZE34338.1 S9 family peptidase [Rhodococcus sp. 05-2254-4]OZE51564.1 S9 family peptidase [Rhodococcus sp. 05-2254-3]OZE53187.1 S9 family peptidase [Rhodococcus sp. 05-2254-2]
MTALAFGSWPSPITAADLSSAGHPVEGGRFVGSEIWWSELRPAEQGRTAICRYVDGEVQPVLPAPFNARTRVHEYGGGAWTATADGDLVFAEFSDQRVYRLTPGAAPVPLTPKPAVASSIRYADLSVVGTDVIAVREMHDAGAVSRDIVAIDLGGGGVRSLVAGSDFLAFPRLSPDGTHIAWIAWNHPQMPWDGTELRVASLAEPSSWTVLLGSTEESVLQPEWIDDESLYAIGDRSGWWNLYSVKLDGSVTPLLTLDADFGAPLWRLGSSWYEVLDDGTLLTVRTVGTDTLALLDPASGVLEDIALDGMTSVGLGGRSGSTVLIKGGGAYVASALFALDLESRELTAVRSGFESVPDSAYLPEGRQVTFQGPNREVHAITYAPRNPDYEGLDGELPPYVAFVHGGPTAHVAPALNPLFAYFTSRGIGVVDVNYGGSSGYGREYRNRLRGQWGVVDVEDTIAAVQGLADSGLADPARLAIEGGSAGGWTVLAALTSSDVFACGASYFGVAELELFVAETHDFESRYIDGLIGPLPEAIDLYRTRAPVNNVDGLSCPVLLLQGLDDPIVPPSQAERFRDAMVSKGIPHAYLAYAGESHGFRKLETQVNARESELSFYGQVMGFTPPGIPELQLWRPSS